jgi:hypothetical protein
MLLMRAVPLVSFRNGAVASLQRPIELWRRREGLMSASGRLCLRVPRPVRGRGRNTKMGHQEEAPIAPDTFGFVEYFVTDIATEISGTNVRMICGVRRGGQIHWLYSSVMPAELLLTNSKQCGTAAEQAFNLIRMGRRGAH